MICFLTSRTDIDDAGVLDPSNGFIDELRNCFPENCRAVYVCSDPVRWDIMDKYTAYTYSSFVSSGFSFKNFIPLDGRNEEYAKILIGNSDMVILCGGHVPTQNRFFRKIGLREILGEYQGIVIGISAGSMNSADTVYSQPELEGEALDPEYEKFLPGLGLTDTNLLPHYQECRDEVLDGLRVFEDITYPDSMGRTFCAIPDGSYLFIKDGREELRGEAYMIRDGVLTQISENGGSVEL